MSVYFLLLLFSFISLLFLFISFLLVGHGRRRCRYGRCCTALKVVLFGRAHGRRRCERVRGRDHDMVVAAAMLILLDSQALFSSGLVSRGATTKLNGGMMRFLFCFSFFDQISH